MVHARHYEMMRTGDRDLCYYNEKCYRPYGSKEAIGTLILIIIRFYPPPFFISSCFILTFRWFYQNSHFPSDHYDVSVNGLASNLPFMVHGVLLILYFSFAESYCKANGHK